MLATLRRRCSCWGKHAVPACAVCERASRSHGCPVQFGQQEPGTNAEIEQFVASHYGAQFHLMSKVRACWPHNRTMLSVHMPATVGRAWKNAAQQARPASWAYLSATACIAFLPLCVQVEVNGPGAHYSACKLLLLFSTSNGKSAPQVQVEVNGPGAHPMFAWLKQHTPGDETGFAVGEDIRWNFEKVGRRAAHPAQWYAG